MLQNHQNDILKSRKSLSGANNISNIAANNEITQALTVLIQEMTGLKQTVNALQNEIVTIKTKKTDVNEVQSQMGIQESSIYDKWTDEDENPKVDVYKQQLSVQQKSVTLFQSPIKVDVDQLKGDTNSFFKETPKTEEPEESVLEEVVDSEDKSTFKMSGDKEKLKEQPKKVIESPKEQPKKVTEVPIETEQDKKKESSSSELIKDNKLLLSEKQNIEEQSSKEQSSKEHIIKKIIRKPIPIKKNELDTTSHMTERYDINNNLITSEDNIK